MPSKIMVHYQEIWLDTSILHGSFDLWKVSEELWTWINNTQSLGVLIPDKQHIA